MGTMLTPDDIADRCVVRRATVMAWFRSGYLPGTRLGKQWRIAADDFEAWLTARSTGEQYPRAAS